MKVLGRAVKLTEVADDYFDNATAVYVVNTSTTLPEWIEIGGEGGKSICVGPGKAFELSLELGEGLYTYGSGAGNNVFVTQISSTGY
jgi:hypothetical protein